MDGVLAGRARDPEVHEEATLEEAQAVLDNERQAVREDTKAPDEDRVTLRDLFRLLEADYKKKRRRSIDTMKCSFKHFFSFFGEKARAVRLGDRL